MSEMNETIETESQPQKPTTNNYVDNDRFYYILTQAIPYFKEHNHWGIYGNELGLIINEMMNRIKNKSNYKNYNGNHWESMQETALFNVFKFMPKYKLEKTNPFAYFSTIIENAFRTTLRLMKRGVSEIPYESEILSEIIDANSSYTFEDRVNAEIDEAIVQERINAYNQGKFSGKYLNKKEPTPMTEKELVDLIPDYHEKI